MTMKRIFSFVWETAKIVLIALVIIIPIRYYLIQPFFVRGASMEPNFSNGQYLVIDELSYRFEDPARGDVIVFKYPLNPSQYFIKRIIGLPGEEVKIRDGQVFIYDVDFAQEVTLDESSYLSGETFTLGQVNFSLGEREYFVLGDNRQSSSDSRRWGALPQDNIVGRVWLRAWPFNLAETF